MRVKIRRHKRKPYVRRDGTSVKGTIVSEHERKIEELKKTAEVEEKRSEIEKAKSEALRAKYLAEEQKARAEHQREVTRSLIAKSKEDRVRALKELRKKDGGGNLLTSIASLPFKKKRGNRSELSLQGKQLELQKTREYIAAMNEKNKRKEELKRMEGEMERVINKEKELKRMEEARKKEEARRKKEEERKKKEEEEARRARGDWRVYV